MAVGRKIWALMAVLTTIALTSYTVQAILEESNLSLEQSITEKVVAKEATGEAEEVNDGFSGMIELATEWVMNTD